MRSIACCGAAQWSPSLAADTAHWTRDLTIRPLSTLSLSRPSLPRHGENITADAEVICEASLALDDVMTSGSSTFGVTIAMSEMNRSFTGSMPEFYDRILYCAAPYGLKGSPKSSGAAVRSEPRQGRLLDIVRSFVHRRVYGRVAPKAATDAARKRRQVSGLSGWKLT